MLCTPPATGQTTPSGGQEQQIRQLLQDRNVDEQELRSRLLKRDIDINNLSPEELAQRRPEIETVIAELEAQQSTAPATRPTNQPATSAAGATDEASRSVGQGASVSEAVNEAIQEQTTAKLPPSNIYGHNLFRNKSLSVYRAAENVRPPDTYPLQVGDEIAVTIFGASQSDFLLTIDDQGFVILPNGLRIQIGNIPLGEARTLLANRLNNYYAFKPGQISIRVQAARTIQVGIFGEVENNGSYTLSSINTAFNALVAAGGPNEIGTVRNIRINRGPSVQVIDVYEYLEDPNQSTNLFINDNDIIFVPLAETIVTLEGGVARPMRYELKDDETLEDLLNFAGGATTRAETNNIKVTRYVDGAVEVIDVSTVEIPTFQLQDDDVVEVPVVQNPINNFVAIEGDVSIPGRYAFEPGITLGTLLDRGRLRPTARRDVAFLFRSNNDGTNRLIRLDLSEEARTRNLILQRGDILKVLTQATFTDRATFTIRGAIRDTLSRLPYPQDGSLSLDEAILLAGGLATNAAGEAIIIRTPQNNRELRTYLRVPLSETTATQLMPFDEIIIYSQERFTDRVTVSVQGAVRNSRNVHL